MVLLQKTSAHIVKIGLWLIPFLPLYVSGGMLFPFITGKNFVFRIVVEIIFALWVALAFCDPRFRPRLTPLVKAVTIFTAVLFFADLFSPHPWRSFFSNYERMEGFMMLLHLYLYFLMISSTFRTRRDWFIFFHTNLAASLIVSFVALLQKAGYLISIQGGYRVDSTIGNPAYLAAYLSFQVGILALLLRALWQKIGLRIFYLSALFFELLIIYFTATRGAAVAFVAAVPLLLFLSILFWRDVFPRFGRYRSWAIGMLVVVLVIPVLFWMVKDIPAIRSSQVLNRFATISLSDRTTQARFSIWRMSLKGVMERPVLGWGQENYYLVFQRYFDPKLYASEPWFDRSHNLFLDWLIHAGILGIGSFLAILGAVGYRLYDGIWNRRFVDPGEGIILAAVFTSYLIQNIFVFDNLNTYILFFAFLGYADHLGRQPVEIPEQGERKRKNFARHSPAPASGKLMSAAGAMLVLVAIAFPFLHFRPIMQSRALVRSLAAYNSPARPDEVLEEFKKALSYDSFGTTEVREQMANIARNLPSNQRFGAEERKRFMAFAIEEMKKEISRPAKDIKHMLFLSAILSQGIPDTPSYSEEAEAVLKEAIRIAPTKQILSFELAQLYVRKNQLAEALDLLHRVSALEPGYAQANLNLLVIALLANHEGFAREARSRLDLNEIGEEWLERLGTLYRSKNDFSSAESVYAELVRRFGEKAQYHATFAAVLAETGKVDRAIEETEAAARLDPKQFGKEAEIFLDFLRQKKK
jgi:O-antigen ligase